MRHKSQEKTAFSSDALAKSDSQGKEQPWERQVRALVDSALDAIIAIDVQGRVIDWNRRAEQILGWTRAETLGLELAELIIPPDYRERHRKGLENYRQTGEAPVLDQRLELVAQRKDGREVPVELSITKIETEGGVFFNAFVRDISDWRVREESQNRQVMEAQLLEQTTIHTATAESFEQSLHRCLDIICREIGWPIGHVFLPDDSRLKLVSTKIWYVGKTVPHFDDFRAITESKEFAMGEGLPGRIWQRAEPEWVEDILVSSNFPRRENFLEFPFRSALGFPVVSNGELLAVLEFFHTHTVQRDERLQRLVRSVGYRVGEVIQSRRREEQQARLAAIVDSSYDAIIGKSLRGTITSWNAGAERVYGYAADEAIGKTVRLILPTQVPSEEEEIIHAIRTGQRLDQFETVRRRKDNRLIPVSLTISPIRDARGRVIGTSSIERDITQRRRSEAELRQAVDDAERANRVRGEFLANVSHELRTPMNAILGMTQLALEETDLSPTLREYLGTAYESARTLLSLVNDILDFSKLEAGKFTIDEEPFSLQDLLDETVKALSGRAFEKGLELACEIDRAVPDQLMGDAVRLRQILTNLIGNAIKFTAQGEVLVRVELVRKWPNETRLQFAVVDTGVGISPDDRRRIFEPFTQADSSSTRKYGGTGLGLAICNELLRLMGGALKLDSKVGVGSRFSFKLSFRRPPHAPRRQSDNVRINELRNVKVLIVDDNETSRRILAQFLENWKMQVETAKNAEHAWEKMTKARSNDEAFDLLMVDALMPGMNGVTFVEKVNSSFSQPPRLVLMMSSADRKLSTQSRIAEASLQKPVSQSDLLDAIMTALNVEPSEEGIEPATPSKPVTPLSILIAEDTPANQKVVTAILKRRGHRVLSANNGREAIQLFRQGDFDVVLMDVQMPIMDGFQATDALREIEKERHRSTPIIALTAHAMRGDQERCLQAGMDAYLAKPIEPAELIAMVESVKRDAIEQRPRSRSGDSDFNRGDRVLDLEGTMKRLGNDLDLYREFVSYYDEDRPGLVARIEAAITNGDADALERAAHALKGLVANLGGAAVVACAFELEKVGKSGQLRKAAPAFRHLKDEVERLEEALAGFRK